MNCGGTSITQIDNTNYCPDIGMAFFWSLITLLFCYIIYRFLILNDQPLTLPQNNIENGMFGPNAQNQFEMNKMQNEYNEQEKIKQERIKQERRKILLQRQKEAYEEIQRKNREEQLKQGNSFNAIEQRIIDNNDSSDEVMKEK